MGDTYRADSWLLYTYIMTDEMEEAERLLKSLKDRVYYEHLLSMFDFLIFLKSGEYDEAIDMLEKRIEKRDTGMCYIKIMEVYDHLRDEPRFKALLRKMGLE